MSYTQAMGAPVRDRDRVLTEAVLKAAGLLDLSDHALEQILQLDAGIIASVRDGQTVFAEGSTAFSRGTSLARLFRSLDALVGGNEDIARQWLRTKNTVLKAIPLELIQSGDGLDHVIVYLDSRRAQI